MNRGTRADGFEAFWQGASGAAHEDAKKSQEPLARCQRFHARMSDAAWSDQATESDCGGRSVLNQMAADGYA